MSEFDMADYYAKVCAGYLTSWVVRRKQAPETVAKAIATVARKRGIGVRTMSDIARQVKELSVDGFSVERLERFNQLTSALRSMQVL